jgi:hypothetical protein
MMEQGPARIQNGAGAIDTLTPPSPVFFAPPSFPAIVDEMEVFFQRVSPGADWASTVVPTSGVNSLMRAAEPSSGLTKEARKLVQAHAVTSIAAVSAAPTPAYGRRHIALVKRRMSMVAALTGTDGAPVGVAAVRKVLR